MLPIRTMLLRPPLLPLLLPVRRRRRELEDDDEESDQLGLLVRPDTAVPLPKTLLLSPKLTPASAHRSSNPSRSFFNDDSGAGSESSHFGRLRPAPPAAWFLAVLLVVLPLVVAAALPSIFPPLWLLVPNPPPRFEVLLLLLAVIALWATSNGTPP